MPAAPSETTTAFAPSIRLLGAHMPTAGGLDKSLRNGAAIGCTAVQVFTCSPRQWSHPPLDPDMAARFKQAQIDEGIAFTVAHDSYLINLCAPDSAVLERSCGAFRGELERAETLGIPWVVTHMGAHMSSGEESALGLLCESLNNTLRETENMQVGIALETTAGQGTCLGHQFEHLARVVDGCAAHPRLGVCLDTCHIFVAGYDIRDEESYEKTFSRFGELIGFDRLKVIHANDAKKPLGSRVDRHEHIGEGEIGLEPFRRLVNDRRMLHVPVVVETPDADTMHAVNVDRLRKLASGEEPAVRVTVHLFGHFRDVRPDAFAFDAPPGSTAADLAARLAQEDARLAALPTLCRIAVNEEYAPGQTPLASGDVVAFIPPMSGG